MTHATTHIGQTPYHMDVNSGGGNQLVADEPATLGGSNTGFSPDELLCAALGTCTAATLRMYANRKQWPLDAVDVKVSFERSLTFSETVIHRHITLHGNLSDEQRARLLDIAEKCPIHKTLSNPITISTVNT